MESDSIFSPDHQWLKLKPLTEPTPPFPEPEHTSRDPFPTTFLPPKPMLDLEGLAYTYGWRSTLTYARGWGEHGTTGKPTRLRHTLALRVGGRPDTDHRAVAIYGTAVDRRAWTWDTVVLFGPSLPCVHVGITELKAFLVNPHRDIPMWLADVAELKSMVAAERAATAAPRAAPVRRQKDHA